MPHPKSAIHNHSRVYNLLLCAFITICFSAAIYVPSLRAEKGAAYSDQQALVDNCATTFKSLMTDPNMGWLRTHIQSAKGIFICPRYMKGAFIFGADGGTGVVLGRDNRQGVWSYPAFYGMGSISFGLQAGAEVSEIVLLVMTDNGMDALLSTSFKLGADASVAAGPVGAGAKAQTTDILAFARSSGLFGGISIEGAVISSRDSWNRKYYGRDVRPVDIIIRRNVSNPGADYLRHLVSSTISSQKPAPAPAPAPAPQSEPENEPSHHVEEAPISDSPAPGNI